MWKFFLLLQIGKTSQFETYALRFQWLFDQFDSVCIKNCVLFIDVTLRHKIISKRYWKYSSNKKRLRLNGNWQDKRNFNLHLECSFPKNEYGNNNQPTFRHVQPWIFEKTIDAYWLRCTFFCRFLFHLALNSHTNYPNNQKCVMETRFELATAVCISNFVHMPHDHVSFIHRWWWNFSYARIVII